MGNLALLAASAVIALLGWGWLDALKTGVFDFLSVFKKIPELWSDAPAQEEVLTEEEDGDAMEEKAGEDAGTELDDELDTLEDDLDAESAGLESELEGIELTP
ncbi:MAG TPA: hypothetical protein VD862_02560 [Candidatus Paceibacterota bacterium]|nr:hypothetical protein [Candidatus Paceibacterota bacterium]